MKVVWLVIPLVLIGIIGIQDGDARPVDTLRVTNLDGDSLDRIKPGQQVLLSYSLRYQALPDLEKSCIVENINLNCSSISSKSIVVGDKIRPSNYTVKSVTVIFQVQDEKDRTLYLSWVDGESSPIQIKTVESAWMPETLGTYTATVFIWSSLNNPTALAPPVSTTISVTEHSEFLENKSNISRGCTIADGTWLNDYHECESSSVTELFENYCNIYGGTYDSCNSGCRHSPDWPNVICAAQCIAVCEFE